jgi:hypothetical protein
MTTNTIGLTVLMGSLLLSLSSTSAAGAFRATNEGDPEDQSGDEGGGDEGGGGDDGGGSGGSGSGGSGGGETTSAVTTTASGDEAPTASDVIIFPDGTEESLSGVTIRNWTTPGWKLPAWKSWETAKYTMTSGTPTPSVVVLHETGSDAASLDSRAMVHFFVARDGTINQVAPMSRRYAHSPLVKRSIGIEIANGASGLNCPASGALDTLTVDWMGCIGTKLAMPSAVQLQSIHRLVDLLADKFGMTKQVANATLAPGYFLASAQGVDTGSAVQSHLDAYQGVLSHSILLEPAGRNDGGTAALYLFYRWDGNNHDYAYCKLREVVPTKRMDRTPTSKLSFSNASALTWLIPYDLNEEDGSCYKYK